MKTRCILALALVVLTDSTRGQEQPRESLNVRISFGHRAAGRTAFTPQVLAGSPGMRVRVVGAGKPMTVGAGDVDSVTAEVSWPKPSKPPLKPHSIWQHLFDHGSPGQVARLRDDPGLQPDAPVLTVLTAVDGRRGFSIGLEQLARHRAMWMPESDAFVTLADAPVEFGTHVRLMKGERVLDRVKTEPEATLAAWTHTWADFGNPTQPHHGQETAWLGTRGHLTGFVARHGGLYKFGVDRWANVRPDFASPHQFRFDPLEPGARWMGQRIVDGLPVLVTLLERNGQRFEVEQFAAPLPVTPAGPRPESSLPSPASRGGAGARKEGDPRGEVASVFLTRIQISGVAGAVNFGFRLATESTNRHPELRQVEGRPCIVDRETGSVWLMVELGPGLALEARASVASETGPQAAFGCVGQLAAGETREVVFKLASPVVAARAAASLAGLDIGRARAATLAYWEEWLARGARFEVPEKAVNRLFRANLWHALMLPRFRDQDRIDLPYSNFAYGQFNADWPINQAVYVDYMLYGLRGHFDVAEQEYAAMYRSQQKPDGRVGGYAEWGVYSPGMLYAVAQHFLLSGDRASFQRLLPASLRAMDWCLREVAQAQDSVDAPGLIVAPLNDLTPGKRAWGFPNGYFVAGLDLFARALATFGHPRAAEVRAVAGRMQADVTAAFERASVRSPVVQLGDGTWSNHVPCDALTPRRLIDEWYPTDVDCGPLHMARLAAIDPRGWLATAMLHDHEDNLFLDQQGAANEPVYNMQATAYLRRDEPEAAIRAFYSMMACAFSHHQLTPLEHRWAWGQYYMPPSTDGAWFELYRNMLVNELAGDGTLFIGQAIPRAWLSDGNRIRIERAPTWFGPVSFSVYSRSAAGEIAVTIDPPSRERPRTLLVRLRHPEGKRLQSVTVNGRAWSAFDAGRETIRVEAPGEVRYSIKARY